MNSPEKKKATQATTEHVLGGRLAVCPSSCQQIKSCPYEEDACKALRECTKGGPIALYST